jgi:adenylate cyclase
MAEGPRFRPAGTEPTEPQISRALIEAELKSILTSRQFARSIRLRQLLRFVVQRTLQGDLTSLKEYTIGVDVFGRKEAFDQRTDAIVRVQANRLRRKLKLYYATEGASHSIRIALPPGGFVPQFSQRKQMVTARDHSHRPLREATVPARHSSDA